MHLFFINYLKLSFILNLLLLSLTNKYIYGRRVLENEKKKFPFPNYQLERRKRGVYKKMPFKWVFPIPYTVEDPVNRTIIDEAINFIQNETCIRFKYVDKLNETGIKYINGKGCFSIVGKLSQTEPQNITIGRDCERVGIVQHETSHALGLLHEHTRDDRDNYINIEYNNINKEYWLDFQKFNDSWSDTYNLRYDYGSALHYETYAGTKNLQQSIKLKDYVYSKTVGQRSQLSFNDIKLLNLYYCSSICKNDLKCYDKSYLNPNDCTRCKCPRLLDGKKCQKLKKSDKFCGKQLLEAKFYRKKLQVYGRKSCYFKIFTDPGYKVRIKIKKLRVRSSDICEPNSSIEINYLQNKAVSGAMFCGRSKNIILKSEGTDAIIHYIGLRPIDFMELQYRKIKI
uniref:Metalloendopeptidase n=1 Tax=Strongyloides papillosus TaxID=174720 RepID=A0A0N5C132_STREA